MRTEQTIIEDIIKLSSSLPIPEQRMLLDLILELQRTIESERQRFINELLQNKLKIQELSE